MFDKWISLTFISGIENIETIGDFAFSISGLSTFEWPSQCTVIPKGCFYFSRLISISGISNVLTISESAFESSLITEIE